MFEEIKRAAEVIREMNERRRTLAEKLRNTSKIFTEALEKEIVKPVEKITLNTDIAANDSGFVAEELYGAHVILGKACSVLFSYRDSKLHNVEYFPSAVPPTVKDIATGLDEREILWHKNLFRLKLELENALAALDEFSPEVFLMDGSLLPLPSDKPDKQSKLYENYEYVLSLFKELYEKARRKDVLLLGIVKDSRSRRFLEVVKREVDDRGNDVVFLDYLLNAGERTFVMKSGSEMAKDIPAWGEKINIFYLKASAEDLPLRIEFLPSRKTFDEIASLVYSLSSFSSSYAYPPPLIEADLRVMMDRKELDMIKELLDVYSFRSIRPLRRNARPFR